MTGRTPRRLRALALLIVLFAAGCASGRYPVTGRVVYEDGAPVEEGTVIAEATVDGKLVALQGNIAKDGTFSLGTAKPGDGARPGTYKVLIMPRALSDAEMSEGKRPAVSSKYAKFETSGITLEVKAESNVLNITVARPNAKEKLQPEDN